MWPLLGGIASGVLGMFGQNAANDNQRAINAENWAHSLYMANNSVQMKVKDATKAGVHPLYALGAPTMSFAPAQAGALGNNQFSSVASAMRDMGQNLSRETAATESPGGKVSGVVAAQTVAGNTLDLENKKLNNEILKARLGLLTQPGTPPGAPFVVPENNKKEERPPLMLLGRRWDTNPNTSPMKAWEDQYGDDGPASWILPPVIGANDIFHQWSKSTPQDYSGWSTKSGIGSGTSTVERLWNQLKAQRWVY